MDSKRLAKELERQEDLCEATGNRRKAITFWGVRHLLQLATKYGLGGEIEIDEKELRRRTIEWNKPQNQ